jgi:hypothetical protein
MKPEAQRIAIAEAHLGIRLANRFIDDTLFISTSKQRDKIRKLGCRTPHGELWVDSLPDYLSDLNAMQAAVLSQSDEFQFGIRGRAEF